MATMQETLKASSGIDLKELLEGFAGKGAVQQLSSDKPVVSVVEDEKRSRKRERIVRRERPLVSTMLEVLL